MTDDTLRKSHYDIVIVGAGLVGASMANMLARQNQTLSIALVDSAPPPTLHMDKIDARVVAITKASESILRLTGVWDVISNLRVCPYKTMDVWDGAGTASIRFDSEHIHEDCLGHIVENAILVHSLHNALRDHENIEIAYHVNIVECRQESGKYRLVLDNGQEIDGSLVVAADGARSALREMAGFSMWQGDTGHTAIVTTVQTERSHAYTAWQRFDEQGPLAFLPLGKDENHCSIVWSVKHEFAQAIMELSDEDFCEVLGRTFEYRLGNICHADKRISFVLKQRHVRAYFKPGIVLVGDAAHTIHPLAGQGANLGLYDVRVLAEEIQRASSRNIPLSDMSILKRYERRRRGHNQAAIATMDGFQRLFGSDAIGLRWLRNEGLRLVDKHVWLKKQLAKVASGRV